MADWYGTMLEPYAKIVAGDLSFTGTTALSLRDPIGVGAVGGSGTRLLAQVLSASGVAMASPLNEAGDAMEWPPPRRLLSEGMLNRYPRELILRNAYRGFEQLLIQRRERLGLHGRAGWKVPSTFYWLRELGAFFPGFQYIHLMRSGLDMAYSGNQNQARRWAPSLGVPLELTADNRPTPHSMLEYWLRANEQALETAAHCLPGRMLIVRFEKLCEEPRETLEELMTFLGLDSSQEHLSEISALVRQPSSVGRYRLRDWREDFSEPQLARLEQLGYTP